MMEPWPRNMRTVDDLTKRFVDAFLETFHFRSGSLGSRPVLSRMGFGSHVAPCLRPALESAPWIYRRRTTEGAQRLSPNHERALVAPK